MASNWQTIDYDTQFHAWLDMTTKGGCYVIYLDGQLTYIGQAANVRKRIGSYRIGWGYGDSILTPWGHCSAVKIKISLTRRYGDWAMIELRLIRRLQPKANCVGSKRRRNAKPNRYAPAIQQSQ